MSSKLNSGVRYVYMRVGAHWERLRVKADMVLFASNTVWSISERFWGIREDALYKSMLPLPFTWLQMLANINSAPIQI